MIDRLLRPFVCDQLKALMEKLETQEFDTRSLQRIAILINDLELTFFERYVVRRVYKRVSRAYSMNRIMEEIIIGQGQYDINMDINAKLRHAIDNGTTNANMLMQGTAMWNGNVPPSTTTAPQSKRVVIRPKASA